MHDVLSCLATGVPRYAFTVIYLPYSGASWKTDGHDILSATMIYIPFLTVYQ